MNYHLGIDAGSSYIKLALIDDTDTLAFRGVIQRGADIDASCRTCLDDLLNRCEVDRSQIAGIIATGYGRRQVTFCDEIVTEIAALAVGSHAVEPTVRCVIDIGGQDSKVIALDPSGRVLDFMMNHKCSAGTGKFLEVTSASLGVPVEQLGPLSRRSEKSLSLSSTCTVFAESEIISCIARGEKREDIIRALHRTISGQVRSLYSQVNSFSEGKIVFVGGLALNVGMIDELSEALTQRVLVPAKPQFVGAFGAAVFLRRKMKAVLTP
jgi:predicted CoA-substrate-specific enzyme activase